MPPKPGRGRGRPPKGTRGRGRPRKNRPAASASASEEKTGDNEGREEMPPQLQGSRKENSEAIGNEDKLQSSAKVDAAQGTEEVPGTKRKRRGDPVADPSSLEPKTSRLRPRQHAPVAEEEEPKKKKIIDGSSLMCHQCQRNDSGRVVRCMGCSGVERRCRYCVKCIKRWYPNLSEDDFVNKCPVCCGNCNCKACLRRDITRVSSKAGKKRQVKKADEQDMPKEDIINFSLRIVRFLLPWLKEFHQGQMLERNVEASIRGVDPSKVEVPLVKCSRDERIYCDNCRTSIVDFHRSCNECSYDLCLSCCQELRQVLSPGVGDVTRCKTTGQSDIGGQGDHIYDKFPSQKTSCGQNSMLIGNTVPSVDRVSSLKWWRINDNGSIPCPPPEFGGCGSSLLELKCLFERNFIADLLEKADSVVKSGTILDLGGSKCSCFTESSGINDELVRKSASRENSHDNYIYCPAARDVQNGSLDHFQEHWLKGHPVIVRDTLALTSGLSWEPMVMWRALREKRDTKKDERLEVTAVECLTWCERGYTLCTWNVHMHRKSSHS